ncbi:unnamed protein product, partial [Allacma fusca]
KQDHTAKGLQSWIISTSIKLHMRKDVRIILPEVSFRNSHSCGNLRRPVCHPLITSLWVQSGCSVFGDHHEEGLGSNVIPQK